MFLPDEWRRSALAEQRAAWRRALSVPSVVSLSRRTEVGRTPHDVVLRQGPHRLLRYRRGTPARQGPPLLMCYALINRAYILDLQPDKSIVRRYLDAGFDVYLIDWGTPGLDEQRLDLADHVCGFLDRCVATVARDHGRDDVHLLGYCMGGTMAAILAALEPARVKTLTLLAAPIDFSGRESLLNLWTDRAVFDVDALLATHGNCPAWFLQSCFQLMKPVQNLVEKPVAFIERLDDPAFMAHHFAMEAWVNDNVPVAGATFRTFVKDLYQENRLVRGELRLGERRVDLGRIQCPILLLSATNDHLVAPSSTEGLRQHVGSTDVTCVRVEAGHVGLIVGGKAQRTAWADATAWLVARSTPTTP